MIEYSLIKNYLKNPNKIAIIYKEKKISYLNLIKYIFFYCSFLKTKIKKRNKILLKHKNSIHWIVCYFAIKLSNNIPVIINNTTTKSKTKQIIKENKIKYIISNKKLNLKNIIKLPLPDMKKTSKIKTIKKNIISKYQYDEILYTSGTTGIPKGVILSKRSSYFIAKMINKVVRLKKKTIELISIPLSHSFGIGRLKCFAVNGHTLVINDEPSNFGKLFTLLEKYKVNGFSMVPSGVEILKKIRFLNFSKIANNLDFIELGSERINKSSLLWLKKIFKKTKIYHHYGMTEASRTAFKVYHKKNGLYNYYKCSPGIKIKFLKKNNKFCKKNGIGELIVNGRSISLGYVNKNIMKNKFSKYGFHSGDFAKKISNNIFELRGRIDNVKKITGIAVNLEEIENHINEFPSISSNLCKFVYDRKTKSFKIHSLFFSKKKIQLNSLIKFLSLRVEKFKIPYKFEKTKSLNDILIKKKIHFPNPQLK